MSTGYPRSENHLAVLGNADYFLFEALGFTVSSFHDDGVTKNPNHHKSTDTPDTLNYEYYLTSTTRLQRIYRSDDIFIDSYTISCR